MKVDCLLSPAEIAALGTGALTGVTCVVFDILRATSTITTAMAHGCQAVQPVLTIEDARAAAQAWPGAKLAGERQGDPIEGFDFGNSPMEFAEAAPERLITTTTNGTVALRVCAAADAVVVASLLNLAAVARWLHARRPAQVLLVCAGTFETAALEDIYAAGALIGLLGQDDITDAAATARAVAWQFGGNALGALEASRNGRALQSKGRGAEVAFCAQRDCYEVVPLLQSGGTNLPQLILNATSER